VQEEKHGIAPERPRSIKFLGVGSLLSDGCCAYSRRRSRKDCGAEAEERENSDRRACMIVPLAID
jgi:hypothetical protein